MIEIPRPAVRQLHGLLRRAAFGRFPASPVAVRQDRAGLRLYSCRNGVGIERLVEGRFAPAALLLPGEALDDLAGRGTEPVVLTEDGSQVVARWLDKGIPRVRAYDPPAADKAPELPGMPDCTEAGGAELLAALAEAVQTTALQPTRFALECVRLDGGTGEVQATDGHQLLVLGGFRLPWGGGLLVPRTPLFQSKDLAAAATEHGVLVGRTEDRLVLVVGPWTVWLPVEKEGRFPEVRDVVPAGRADSRVRLGATDRDFLAASLPRLPGDKAAQSPVTVDANGQVLVRAAGDHGPPTELVLGASGTEGPAVAFATNRRFLARALGFGFREIEVRGPKRPVVCRDGERTYLWQPLSDGLVAADPAASRIAAPDGPVPANPSVPKPATVAPTPNHERTTRPMRESYANGNGHAANGHAAVGRLAEGDAEEAVDPIEAAEALRTVLRDALAKTSELVAALKSQRKTAKLVRTTLESLRQLDVR